MKTLILASLALLVSAVHADPVRHQIPICYNYSCKQQVRLALSDADAAVLQSLFAAPAATPAQERSRISTAITFFELLAAQQTPVFRDRGGNPYDGVFPGQLDCIDESRNTTEYMRFMEALDLLRWHETGDRVMRSPFIFDVHWTATIVERESGQAYAVDSWHRDNGQPPVIQELERWLGKAPIEH